MNPTNMKVMAQAYWDARNEVRMGRLEPPLTLDQLPAKYRKLLETTKILTPIGTQSFEDIPF